MPGERWTSLAVLATVPTRPSGPRPPLLSLRPPATAAALIQLESYSGRENKQTELDQRTESSDYSSRPRSNAIVIYHADTHRLREDKAWLKPLAFWTSGKFSPKKMTTNLYSNKKAEGAIDTEEMRENAFVHSLPKGAKNDS